MSPVDVKTSAAGARDEPPTGQRAHDAVILGAPGHQPHAAAVRPGGGESRAIPEDVPAVRLRRSEAEHAALTVDDDGTAPRIPLERAGIFDRPLLGDHV